jgi:hypothetical protein
MPTATARFSSTTGYRLTRASFPYSAAMRFQSVSAVVHAEPGRQAVSDENASDSSYTVLSHAPIAALRPGVTIGEPITDSRRK